MMSGGGGRVHGIRPTVVRRRHLRLLLGLGALILALFIFTLVVQQVVGRPVGSVSSSVNGEVSIGDAARPGRHDSDVTHRGGQGEQPAGDNVNRTPRVPITVDRAESHTGQSSNDDVGRVDDENFRRREEVRAEFRHAWNGYTRFAFGHDELAPVTNGSNDSWGGFGVTLIDALDTLLIMGISEEFARARDHVAAIDWDRDYDYSFFETTIRHLGGLLSTHALTGDEVFLEQAEALADRLLFAFSESARLPRSIVNFHTHAAKGPRWTSSSILSEVGVQLEYKYLAFASGKWAYAEQTDSVLDALEESPKPVPGLLPVYLDPVTGRGVGDHVSIGALGDSYYEYILKHWLLMRRTDKRLRRMYAEAVDGIVDNLIHRSHPSGLLFLSEMKGGKITFAMDHLTCFVPAMLALGATGATAERDMLIAAELLRTCYEFYVRSGTGLSPDVVYFTDSKNDFTIYDSAYRLRPETVESLFVLYRATRDPKYREWGWNIFKAIRRHCRTEFGYSGVRDVTARGGKVVWDNSMPSFFLSETLKYLYLLFSDDDILPLDDFVFSTEGHPFPVFPLRPE